MQVVGWWCKSCKALMKSTTPLVRSLGDGSNELALQRVHSKRTVVRSVGSDKRLLVHYPGARMVCRALEG